MCVYTYIHIGTHIHIHRTRSLRARSLSADPGQHGRNRSFVEAPIEQGGQSKCGQGEGKTKEGTGGGGARKKAQKPARLMSGPIRVDSYSPLRYLHILLHTFLHYRFASTATRPQV